MTCLALDTFINRCYCEASNSLLQHLTGLTSKLPKDARIDQVVRMVVHHYGATTAREAVEAILTMPIRGLTHSLLMSILLMCLQGLGVIFKVARHHQLEIGGFQIVKYSVNRPSTITGTRKDTRQRTQGKVMGTRLLVGIMAMCHHRLHHIVITVVTGQADSSIVDETLCCQCNLTFDYLLRILSLELFSCPTNILLKSYSMNKGWKFALSCMLNW